MTDKQDDNVQHGIDDNPNDDAKKGAVRKRSQNENPFTESWTKRDTKTGRFTAQKADDKPFKGVRKEKP